MNLVKKRGQKFKRKKSLKTQAKAQLFLIIKLKIRQMLCRAIAIGNNYNNFAYFSA